MIFTYDETAGFEEFDIRNRDEVALLAGAIYFECGEGKIKLTNGRTVEMERARLVKYLDKVCSECGKKFPKDLHYVRELDNRDAERATKKVFDKTLPEFLTKGTFKGKELLYKKGKDGKRVPVPREGQYQLLTLLRYGHTKRESLGNSNLTDEVKASNQYLNMTQDLIKKAVFLNPHLLPDSMEVYFDIPTRVMQVKRSDFASDAEYGRVIDAYKKAGYKLVTIRDKMTGRIIHEHWEVASNGTIQMTVKSCLPIREIREHLENSGSIEYYNPNSDVDVYKNAFLYLADGLCAYIREMAQKDYFSQAEAEEILHDIPSLQAGKESADVEVLDSLKKTIRQKIDLGVPLLESDLPRNKQVSDSVRKTIKEWRKKIEVKVPEEKIARRISALLETLNTPHQNLFFYYDDVDSYFNEAREAEMQGDFFEALSSVFDGRNIIKSSISDYYSDTWFSGIEERIKTATSRKEFEVARKEFEVALDKAVKYSNHEYEKAENLVPEKLLYIYQVLLETAKTFDVRIPILFRLYNLGISAYSHVGDPSGAEKCLNEAIKLKKYVETPDYYKMLNKEITILNDKFQFEKAKARGMDILELNEQDLKRLKTVLDENEKLTENIAHASVYKALGSFGQVLAFNNDASADACFLKVINSSDEIGHMGDIFFTMSHLLHWYITCKDRKNYECFASKYFGGKDSVEDQLDYVMWLKEKEDYQLPSFSYALFVYIKAFYTFYKDDPMKIDILKQLININETVTKDGPTLVGTGHPWELIYKYAALLEYYDPNPNKSFNNISLSEEAVSNSLEGVIDCIVKFGKLEYVVEPLKKGRALYVPLSMQSCDTVSSLYVNGRHKITYKEYKEKLDDAWHAFVKQGVIDDSVKVSDEEKYYIIDSILTFMYR